MASGLGDKVDRHPATGQHVDTARPPNALDLRPNGELDRPVTQLHLAISLLSRFAKCIEGSAEDLDQAIAFQREVAGFAPCNAEDLDEAIALQREALALCPFGHTDRSKPLNNLAAHLFTRFRHRGNAEDSDHAIALLREALALRPVGHTDWPITLQREALALCPVGHTDWFLSLNNLATHLSTRFHHRSNAEDLDEAIALQREALALCPVGHTYRSSSLNNLANRLFTRFHHRGDVEDLDEAIALQREALALCPVGHTDRFLSLNYLATRLSTRFDHRGNAEDLDEAITLQREVLALCPVGHTDQSLSLNNLATRLSTRFDHRGNAEDLDEAIALQREALALCPVGHTDRSLSLNNLATRLSTCFDHRDNAEDLDEAIALQREALALCPVGHRDQSSSLGGLAVQLSARFDHRGNVEDLDEAIALQREALALCPVGHTDRSKSLNHLAIYLSTRFDHRGNAEGLDEAIALQREALALCPVGHTDQSASLNNLATQLSTRGNAKDLNESRDNLRCALTLSMQHDSRQLQGLDGTVPGEDTNNMNAAMHHFKAAVNVVLAGFLCRLQASLRWVGHASQHSHGTQLEAYATSMQLLDTYMSTTASVSSRHNAMKDFPGTLAVDAASCALRSGDTRGDHAVALMERFRDLSSLLDKSPASHPEGSRSIAAEAEATRYRRLVEDWNRVVEEIRKVEGFSHFLLPPLFSDLQDAARDGPVIVLIASESSCNAIIVRHHQSPTGIQLPTNFLKLVRLVLALQEGINKEASPKGNQPALTKALRELWNDVVHPVVEILGGSIYLFIHAIAYRAAEGPQKSRQNLPDGASFMLNGVEPELDLVQSLLPPSPTVSFTKIMSVDAMKLRVLYTLRDNTWLHLSCHGTQKLDEPFKSAFLMRDQPLSLLDITQIDLSRYQFAFISACETAVSDLSTPNEVIHLAAGLQFAGVKSVIGTLWKVNDSTVQHHQENHQSLFPAYVTFYA
ncbi:TPR-like protein [Suillus subalutaceus]|uniref:TPR-like protein n=1 Tax=Suillus subalutaceus TaxID=48586 RepID=UPI001B88495E|nr:TPR-like protein [Suillus subalutaceus]KAG1837334.1 TPR-like protein [Suillus subalutaceus]